MMALMLTTKIIAQRRLPLQPSQIYLIHGLICSCREYTASLAARDVRNTNECRDFLDVVGVHFGGVASEE